MPIDKYQFVRKRSGGYWDRKYVGPVINRMANAEGETRQPWEILRDELPDLLNFRPLYAEDASVRMIEVPLRELYVEQFLPTARHSRERRFVVIPRFASEGRDKYTTDPKTKINWAEEMFGEEPSIQVPIQYATTAEAPVALIIGYTDPRYYGKDKASDVFRWYDGKLWKPAHTQDVVQFVRQKIDTYCLANVISDVLSLSGILVVGNDEVWVQTTEPIVNINGSVEWGKRRDRYGYRTDSDEYREGYTNPVHFLKLTKEGDYLVQAGQDDWTAYYSLLHTDKALEAIDKQHAEYNAAVREDGKDEEIEAVCPFTVTVYRSEALRFERKPRPGELATLELTCPECGGQMIECSVGFKASGERKLDHGVVSGSHTYVGRSLLQPFDTSPLFHFLQCDHCKYREFGNTLEQDLGLDPVDDKHSYEHMNKSALILLETLVAYMEATAADEYAEVLQQITDDWRGAIS